MNQLSDFLNKLNQSSFDPSAVAQSILLSDLGDESKLIRQVRQSAQDVIHFQQQLEHADTDQWQQSFRYELAESLKSLKKNLKKLADQK